MHRSPPTNPPSKIFLRSSAITNDLFYNTDIFFLSPPYAQHNQSGREVWEEWQDFSSSTLLKQFSKTVAMTSTVSERSPGDQFWANVWSQVWWLLTKWGVSFFSWLFNFYNPRIPYGEEHSTWLQLRHAINLHKVTNCWVRPSADSIVHFEGSQPPLLLAVHVPDWHLDLRHVCLHCLSRSVRVGHHTWYLQLCQDLKESQCMQCLCLLSVCLSNTNLFREHNLHLTLLWLHRTKDRRSLIYFVLW